MHLFALVLSDKLLKISLFNHKRFHAVVASERSLRCSWSKSSVSFLLVVLKNWTKSTVIQTFSSHSFNHGLNIKSKLKFPFYSFNECGFGDSTTFVKLASQSNKSVNWIKTITYGIRYLRQNQFCYTTLFPSWFEQNNWGVHSCRVLGFTFGQCLC